MPLSTLAIHSNSFKYSGHRQSHEKGSWQVWGSQLQATSSTIRPSLALPLQKLPTWPCTVYATYLFPKFPKELAAPATWVCTVHADGFLRQGKMLRWNIRMKIGQQTIILMVFWCILKAQTITPNNGRSRAKMAVHDFSRVTRGFFAALRRTKEPGTAVSWRSIIDLSFDTHLFKISPHHGISTKSAVCCSLLCVLKKPHPTVRIHLIFQSFSQKCILDHPGS